MFGSRLQAAAALCSALLTLSHASPVRDVTTLVESPLDMGLQRLNPRDLSIETRQTTKRCSDQFHIIFGGGCSVPCAVDTPRLLVTLIGNITAEYPDVHAYAVPYTNQSNQATISTPLMVNAVQKFAASCPNTPIVLIGYSLGGIIVMNTVCGGLDSSYVGKNVISAITYGEETYVAGKPWNAGTCQVNAPKYPRRDPGTCNPYAYVIQDYCNTGDVECCGAGGPVNGSHLLYPSEYDYAAASFVSKAYQRYLVAHPKPT